MNRNTLAVWALTAVWILAVGCGGQSIPDGPYGVPSRAIPRATASDLVSAEKSYPLSQDATLSDYLAYAALHNPAVGAVFDRWKAAVEAATQAGALPDPRFTYRYFIEEVETRVGAQRQSFELSQTFPWLGTLALRTDAAAQTAQAAQRRYDAAKLDLFGQVKDAYYEYAYLHEAIRVTAQSVELLKQVESVARSRYRSGAAGQQDLLRVQIELDSLTQRLETLSDLRSVLVAKLNAALGRPYDAPVTKPGPIEPTPAVVTDEQWLVRALDANPRLKALDHEAASRRNAIDLARKEYFPDVTLGVGFIDTRDSTGGRRPGDDGKDPLIAMVSVNLPIWRGKLDAGVRKARYLHRAAIRRRLDAEHQLLAQMKLALHKFHDAERRIALHRDSLLPKSSQTIESVLAAYRGGDGSFADLLDAQRVDLQIQLDYQRALADREQRLAELETLAGREAPLPKKDAAAANVETSSQTRTPTTEE